VRIFVDVPEMEAPSVNADDPVLVKVQALPDRSFDAIVARTSWSLLELNHALRAEVDVPNPQGMLRPGMYAAVTIQLDTRSDVLTVPAMAVVREGDETFCLCVESGKIARKPLTLGLRGGGDIEVVSGLDENSLIVVKEPATFRAGQQVLVAPAAT
jgi:multidrug efflux pump subunit AcrA (membrane-fusion protein)